MKTHKCSQQKKKRRNIGQKEQKFHLTLDMDIQSKIRIKKKHKKEIQHIKCWISSTKSQYNLEILHKFNKSIYNRGNPHILEVWTALFLSSWAT